MKEVIEFEEKYYILATAARVDDRTRVLKQGATFAVFDRYGDVTAAGLGELGLYHEDTRFLSLFTLGLGEERPLLLSSTVKDDNSMLVVDLTNPDVREAGELVLHRGTLHLSREKLLWQGACRERLQVTNYGVLPARVSLVVRFAADFHDIFEVRGTTRERRGRLRLPEIRDGEVVLAYEGLDGRTRRLRVGCSPPPKILEEDGFRLEAMLAPHAQAGWEITLQCESGAAPAPRLDFERSRRESAAAFESTRQEECTVFTSNEQFNDFLNRASADLHMMLTRTPSGLYPYAGVPWFSTPFGRDGIITALETLWARPEVAHGVLAYLAATQATETNEEQDAQPGKILHETRCGEMAALGEVPFGRYYGSVDATPLFVILAGAYFSRTGDRAFLSELWPAVEKALAWMEHDGDPDGDGFIEYARMTPRGLAHQGWKDSVDPVFHADGSLAEPPIALCEVQGYAFAARRRAAEVAAALGLRTRARDLWRESEELQRRFDQAFWCEEIGTYAIALDGAKRPCAVRTSNAGHCLYTGIARPDRAQRVARTLLADDMFCGWGVRTVSALEARYNPMSYHNGSVWPHDNALIAQGLSRYRMRGDALRVLAGLFDASLFLDLHRLPELFCGFRRRPGEGPTLYPVACSPQSWAAGAAFLLLEACLGLTVRASERRVRFRHPVLPDFIDEITIRRLRVGDASVDLLLTRHLHDVSVNVLARTGEADVAVVV